MICGLPVSVSAQTTAVPDLTSQRIYTVGSVQGIDQASLRDEITRVEKASRQAYFVVIVKNAGSSDHAAKDFTDRLARTWQEQARAKGVAFDTRRVVVIVLEIDHHKIVVLGGTELQQNFGFRDPYIDRELIQPYFAPAARAGDLTRALRVLIDQTDRWITAKDAEQASHHREVAARTEQLRREAQDAIADARRDMDETRRDLRVRHNEGITNKDFDASLAKITAGLDTAAGKLAQAPAEALDVARQAQRDLTQVADQIRQIPALQADLDQRLSATASIISEVNAAIDNARQAQAPTDAAEQELAQARTELDEARSLIKTDPTKALSRFEAGSQHLHDTLQHAIALPVAQANLANTRSSATQFKSQVDVLYETARQKGLITPELQGPYEEMVKAHKMAETEMASDPVAAMAHYETARRLAESITAQARPRLQKHQLYNRTLPGLAVLTLATLAGAIGWAILNRRRKFRETVLGQFRDYRTRTVGFMEQLDALRSEHRGLLKSDPDFTQPTSGKTLAAYQGLETELNRLWDNWLAMMELWERADGLVKKSRGYDSQQISQAKALIEGEGRFEGIEEQVAACRRQLQELTEAHAVAAREAENATAALATFGQNVAGMKAAGLPTTAYETAVKPAQSLMQKGTEMTTADPLGAIGLVAEARGLVDTLNARLRQVLDLVEKSGAVAKAIERTAGEAATLRRSGILLSEPRANPEPKLEKARKLLEILQANLQRSQVDTAARAAGEAESLSSQADSDLKAHLEARDRCPHRIYEVEGRLADLAEQQKSAKTAMEAIQTQFHADSFTDISPNAAHAAQLQATARNCLDQAVSQSGETRQFYLAALESADQATAAISQAQAELSAIKARHEQLMDLAKAVRADMELLRGDCGELQKLFQLHQREISREAADYFANVVVSIDRLGSQAQAARPNLFELRQQAVTLRNGMELARKQADEDIQGHAKLAEQLTLVRSRLQAVGRLLQQENKDRPPANQRFQQAVESMSRYDQKNPLAESNWDERLRWLQEIAESLDRAESLANQDINLANGAIAEIESAGKAIRKVQAYYRSGISADLGNAESYLEKARQQLNAQEYEAAVNLAQQAEHEASIAWNAAEHQARQRRNQQDRNVVMGDWSVIAGTLEAARRSAEQWSHQSGSGGSFSWPGSDGGWTSDSSSTWGSSDSGSGSDWSGSSSESSW